ncbi:MAG: T9SS type A sorting domain-containing protein, partial [Bacteroidota bacterium]
TLEFVGVGKTYNVTSVGNVSVANAFNISGTSYCIINTGVFDVAGDINITNTASGGGGSAIININGSGTQTLNGAASAGAGVLPQLVINNTTGSINMTGFPGVANNFTYTAGTVNPGSSTFCFVRGSSSSYTINCTASLNNISILPVSNALTLAITGTLVAAGDLSIDGTFNATLNTGTISVGGDISITNTATGGGGTATILINGTGAQALTSTATAGQGKLPLVTIQKISGTLSMSGIISESRAWTFTSGTVDAVTNGSTVVFGGNNLIITSSGMSFNNVIVTANTSTLANSLTVNGDLTINSTGVLAPGANTINVTGDWNNRATAGFTESTSTVNFNGSSLQTITCPAGENFTNLIINNSSSGVQLANAVAASTSLNMTAGNIDLNGNNVTLGTSASVPGTLTYTNGSLINSGSFIRWLKTSTLIPAGSAAGLFPMGTATDKRPFLISAPVTAPTSGGKVSVAYTDATSNSAVTFSDGVAVVLVRKDLNWAVSTTSLAGGSYNLQVQGTGFGSVGNVADLRLTRIGSVVGTAGVNGGTTTNPQVNRTGITLANLTNTFYLASVSTVNSPLPVTLISFSAQQADGKIKLDWETAAEVNNDYFTIQRSGDGVSWQEIKTVKGNGNATVESYYSAYDENPLQGNSFYRLQQTDIDGKKSYSSIRKVNINSSATVTVYPNPARDYITIKSSLPQTMVISFFNSNGQKMEVPVATNTNNTTVNVSSLVPGAYYLQIKQASLIETKRIMILK